MEQQTQNKDFGRLGNAGFLLITLFSFLIPLFFIPSLYAPLQVSKYALFVLFIAVSFFTWVVLTLRSGKLGFHSSYVLGSFVLLSFSYVVAGFFAPSWRESFLGSGAGGESVILIILLSLLGYLTSIFFRSRSKAFLGIVAVHVSFGLIALYYILKLITGWQGLSLGVFGNLISGPIGRWYDVGVFALIAMAISLVFIESRKAISWFRVISGAVLLLSVLVLVVQGLALNWMVAAGISLLLFCYLLSINLSRESSERFPFASLAVLIISLLFIAFGGYLNPIISNSLGISHYEVKPALQTTLEVSADSIKDGYIFGVGPGQFVNAWRLYRPLEVNETVFWNVSYDSGFGAIPSSFATTGILGFASWILLALSVLVSGSKLLFSGRKDPDPITVSVVSATVLLWLIHFIYNPSFIFTAFLFMFAGIMVALSERETGVVFREINISGRSFRFFGSLLVLIILVAVSVWTVYMTARQVASAMIFQKGIVEINIEGDTDSGEQSILNALSLYETGAQERALAEYAITKLNQIITQDPESITQEDFQASVSQSLSFALRAKELNSSNFDNWLMIGAIYEYLASFGVEGAAEASLSHYDEARARDPHTPVINLAKARIDLIRGEVVAARKNISDALEKKQNYAAAYVLLSQIEAGEGNREGALRTMAQAAASAPNDPTIFFQLGSMLFEEERFEEAVGILERAVIANPYYSNAKFLLGLTYYELGRVEDAVAQFEDLRMLNPENALVEELLEIVSSGGDPFEVLGL